MQMNLNFGQRPIHQALVLLLVCFVFAVRVLSGPTYISSAIEHAEIYSGICLNIDPHCYVNEHRQVELEDDPSSALNFFSLAEQPCVHDGRAVCIGCPVALWSDCVAI